jgi:hypothetical protein
VSAPVTPAAIDEMARRLVSQDVRYCVSGLIAGLMGTVNSLSRADQQKLGTDSDDLAGIAYRQPDADDYREAAREAGAFDCPPGTPRGERGSISVEKSDGVWFYTTTDDDGDELDAGQGYDETEAGAWRAGFDSLGIDHPDGTECLEYWLVTDQLARDLRAEGEAVADDIAGLTVWGRCTSGQAIYGDAVIQRIARRILEA